MKWNATSTAKSASRWSAAGRSLGTNGTFAMIAAVKKVLAATGESAVQAVSQLLVLTSGLKVSSPQPMFSSL